VRVGRCFVAEVAAKIAADGGIASHVVADVADREQAANAVSSTVDRHGRLDIVVHSAGMGVLAPVEGADQRQPARVRSAHPAVCPTAVDGVADVVDD
jgi:NAD(P)-dependent dehydrogenase (short-subunit alcohol dehydrogenase family)